MENTNQNDQEIKVTSDQTRLESYEDLSGITIKKLNFGLWWVMNVKFFKRTLFWFVVVLGIIGWLYTFVNFGYYLTVGTNKDEQMLKSMVDARVNKQNVAAPIDLKTGEVEVFANTDDRYDFLVAVKNANPEYYAEFDYSFVINGTSTAVQSGFILPAEEKNIVSLGVQWPESINTAYISLANINWHRIDRHQIPDWPSFRSQHLAFNISEPQFSPAESSGLSEKINVSEIDFSFANDSPYNYYHLPLNILLYSYDRIVGAYQTSLENVGSGEVRKVRLNYSGTVDKVDRVGVVPDLNIMRPDIYFKAGAAN
jgi:hypothetical protein